MAKIIKLPYYLSHFINKNPLFEVDLFFLDLSHGIALMQDEARFQSFRPSEFDFILKSKNIAESGSAQPLLIPDTYMRVSCTFLSSYDYASGKTSLCAVYYNTEH